MRRTMTTRTVVTIEVSPDDFIRCNKAMVKLLLTLYKSKRASMQTMKLYSVAKMSNNYSRLSLRKAERMGYITRRKVAKPKGEKGNDMIVNSLTPRGLQLLQSLEKYQKK
jgi:hypothetical protein